MAIKSVNDTIGFNGLVSTLLVFNAYPRLTSQLQAIITAARAAAVRKAITEVQKLKVRRDMVIIIRTRKNSDITNTLELLISSEIKVWKKNVG
jgi:hypothetical protein